MTGAVRATAAVRRCARLARHRATIPLLAVVAVLACDSPVVPARGDVDAVCAAREPGDFYNFALRTVAVPNGEPVTVPRILHWPRGAEIRVAVVDDEFMATTALASALAAGADAWHRAALYGEYTIARAPTPATADVLLRWSGSPLPVATDECTPNLAGTGVTTFCVDEANPGRLATFRPESSAAADVDSVSMIVTISRNIADEPDHLRKVVAHELGHVIGIGMHSPCAVDLMFSGEIEAAVPSPADRATVQVLYHTQPDIVP